MGYWGVKSYEDDDADFAIDAGLASVHGSAYESLMDDRNPLGYEEIQARMANRLTLAAAIAHLRGEFGEDLDAWDAEQRIAYVGAVIRHAELGVTLPTAVRDRAQSWLVNEDLDWENQPARTQRIRDELAVLAASATDPTDPADPANDANVADVADGTAPND